MLLDIVILPSVHLSRILVRSVQRANRDIRPVYVVGTGGLFYHSSLFHFNVSSKRLPQVESTVKSLAAGLPRLKLVGRRVRYDGDGVWLEFLPPPALVRFKNSIVQSLAPLRQGPMPYTSSYPLTPLRRFYRQRFGVHYNMGRFFKPHFTLAKYKSLTDTKAVSLRLKHFKPSFFVNTLAVTEVNRYHQVTRIIKRFRV